MPPLPDRVAAVLAPHLRLSPPPPPPLLTAAAAAVNASVSSVRKSNGVEQAKHNIAGEHGDDANSHGIQAAVNGSTPLRKEGLLTALRAVGMGKKAPTAKRKGAKGGANSRKKDPLAAGLLAAIEVCRVGQYTLARYPVRLLSRTKSGAGSRARNPFRAICV